MVENLVNTSPLLGKFLVALPQMNDPRFRDAVIFICGHDENGTMGLIINKQLDSLTCAELLDQLNIKHDSLPPEIKLHYGGPVELGRGFILHTQDYMHKSSIKIADDIILTSNLEVLTKIANNTGPSRFLLALGHTGWSSGQLENEIMNDSWIQIDADLDILYSNNMANKWHRSLAKIGVDPDKLSFESGNA